ncbi:hypothetical protein Y032_0050g2006 [Ancylostoma ceylanicum]|nr:hypothetical protein Y032_0050g2006 [Ancylostoma ceylanicum]
MTLADKHLSYMGDDGVSYNLSEVTHNLEAYLKTTDAVLRDVCTLNFFGLQRNDPLGKVSFYFRLQFPRSKFAQ